ncbi:PREDICTED: uncharacterized protein LOC103619603 [Corvus brachyrhynchos]|uniref:uncharacterized protein LOC103619603 n=1 Tax=Corvus brachyrhynchos TaxID=85066 RepID=UPI00081660FF|nr:PREDICTED: uncharacterized protein LOC103619603 [Corvus brachyrhynchos]
MTFCYQRQCEDSCYSPCRYRTRDCCPSYSPRYCSPYSTRYFQRYSYGSCYPCYQC